MDFLLRQQLVSTHADKPSACDMHYLCVVGELYVLSIFTEDWTSVYLNSPLKLVSQNSRNIITACLCACHMTAVAPSGGM